ncbi:MAG: DNA replication/repair protein RecF [Caldilineaceae bacterium]|nr:DNA replication/repair protein RecF [Caldilineaceae bacterium]
MFLTHLHLTHFRNYQHLDLDFRAPLTLIQGRNAQGKSNLLDAIYYLATSKSSHARAEREVVGWSAETEPIPYTQIAGTVRKDREIHKLEVLFTPRNGDHNFTKQVRINGVSRRGIDLIGEMRVVLFLPEDVILVAGSPSDRRRYLDIALCQIERSYCQHLSRYQKVLAQRNSLLRNLREAGASSRDPGVISQLTFWDDQLVHHGAYVLARRYTFVRAMDPIGRARHARLSNEQEMLHLVYLPSFNVGNVSEADYRRLMDGDTTPDLIPLPDPPPTARGIEEIFRRKLDSRRDRELMAGNTLYGPHRDDMGFVVNGRDLRTYGSRGQQRTAALSLKLAEMETMIADTRETPLLLLDDVMSELDETRRGMLLEVLAGVEQAIVTTTDWSDFSPDFRKQAQLLRVEAGQIEEMKRE